MLSWFADNIQINGTVLNTHIHPIKMRPTNPNPEIAELHISAAGGMDDVISSTCESSRLQID